MWSKLESRVAGLERARHRAKRRVHELRAEVDELKKRLESVDDIKRSVTELAASKRPRVDLTLRQKYTAEEVAFVRVVRLVRDDKQDLLDGTFSRPVTVEWLCETVRGKSVAHYVERCGAQADGDTAPNVEKAMNWLASYSTIGGQPKLHVIVGLLAVMHVEVGGPAFPLVRRYQALISLIRKAKVDDQIKAAVAKAQRSAADPGAEAPPQALDDLDAEDPPQLLRVDAE